MKYFFILSSFLFISFFIIQKGYAQTSQQTPPFVCVGNNEETSPGPCLTLGPTQETLFVNPTSIPTPTEIIQPTSFPTTTVVPVSQVNQQAAVTPTIAPQITQSPASAQTSLSNNSSNSVILQDLLQLLQILIQQIIQAVTGVSLPITLPTPVANPTVTPTPVAATPTTVPTPSATPTSTSTPTPTITSTPTPTPTITPTPTPEHFDAPTGYSDTPYVNYVDLGWASVSGATFYHYQVLKGSTVVSDGITMADHTSVINLTPDTVYTWRVSVDPDGDWTPFVSFTTKAS